VELPKIRQIWKSNGPAIQGQAISNDRNACHLQAAKDKLSYFDTFQFIQHVLQIKLENWEEDALEGRLDRLGMAFIEFNEFNEFSREHGIDWGEDLLENDL